MAQNDVSIAEGSPPHTLAATSASTHSTVSLPPRRRRGLPVAFFPPLLGFFSRHVVRPVASVLRSMALDVLGFSLGIASSLVLGALVAGKKRTFRITSPPVGRIRDVSSPRHLRSLRDCLPPWVKFPDMESARWLNRALAQLWPYLDTAASGIILEVLQDTLRRAGVPPDMVKFKLLTFGTFPLVVEAVRAVPRVEEVCCLELKLSLASNCNAVVALHPAGLPVGHLQLKELCASVWLRVTLSPLIPQLPGFAGIRLSLLEPPELDYGIIIPGGFDITAVPSALLFLRSSVSEALKTHIVWPNSIVIDFLSYSQSRAIGTVFVKVVSARGLRLPGLSLVEFILGELPPPSPYVKAFVRPRHTVQTSTHLSTATPKWNEALYVPFWDAHSDVLTIQVMHYSPIFLDEVIGFATLSLEELRRRHGQVMTVALESADGQHSGQIDILPKLHVLQLNSLKSPATITSERYGEDVLHDQSVPLSTYGILEVILRRGINLDRGNWGDDVFFYCKLRLQSTSADEHYETKAVNGYGSITWDETFIWMLESKRVRSLEVEIRRYYQPLLILPKIEEVVGVAQVSVQDVVKNRRIVDTFPLLGSRSGQISMKLLWRHF